MPDITTILSPACTKASVEAHSRKRALEAAADLVAEHHPDLSARKLFDELMARERLGSTGLGDGVAIPHCRIPCEQITGALLVCAGLSLLAWAGVGRPEFPWIRLLPLAATLGGAALVLVGPRSARPLPGDGPPP